MVLPANLAHRGCRNCPSWREGKGREAQKGAIVRNAQPSPSRASIGNAERAREVSSASPVPSLPGCRGCVWGHCSHGGHGPRRLWHCSLSLCIRQSRAVSHGFAGTFAGTLPHPRSSRAWLRAAAALRMEGAPLLGAGRYSRASALELCGFPAAPASNLLAVPQTESDAGLIPGWFQDLPAQLLQQVSLAGTCTANIACRNLQPLCSTWERYLCALSA